MRASSLPPAGEGVLSPLPWTSAVDLLALPSSLAPLISEAARSARIIGIASRPLGAQRDPARSVTREESLSLQNRLWNRCQKWIRPDENSASSLAVSPIVCAVGLGARASRRRKENERGAGISRFSLPQRHVPKRRIWNYRQRTGGETTPATQPLREYA